ncbi:MAG: hypothetical protein HZA88_16720 [Verrucomicrobia bacterium]|nr:hypothetical protein [Verrucomicrobiota bacterium]
MSKWILAAALVTSVVLVTGCTSTEQGARQQTQAKPAATSLPAYGIRTNRPGLVRSPWNPNGPLVDVTGFTPGSRAKDPTTGKDFIVP